MKFLTNKLNLIVLLLAFYILLSLIVGGLTYNKEMTDRKLDVGTIDYVKVIEEDGRNYRSKMPLRIYTQEKFELIVDVSEYLDRKNVSLTTFANFANLQIYSDDKLLYEKNTSTDDIIGSGSYYIVFCDLPEDLPSPYLHLKFEPLLASQNHTYVPDIFIGEKSHIILQKLFISLDHVAIVFIMIFNFIFMVVLAVFDREFFKRENYSLLYLAILGLLVACYFSSQIWMVKYLLLPFNTVVDFIGFTALSALPIPLLAFFKYKLDPKFKSLYNIVITILFVNVFAQTVLTLAAIYEYIDMLFFTNMSIIFALIIIVITFVLTDSKKYPNKKSLILPLILIVFVFVVPVLLYLSNISISFDLISIPATVLFVILELRELLLSFSLYQEDKRQKEEYKKLAIIDTLTGLKNRAAYNAFVEEFNARYDCTWLISIDLDNLKFINDNYGHLAGDQFIVDFAQILRAIELKNNKFKAYRMGGDEFYLFLLEDKDFLVDDLIKEIRTTFEKTENFAHEKSPSFSVGSCFIDDFNKQSLRKALLEADEKMYLDKKRFK